MRQYLRIESFSFHYVSICCIEILGSSDVNENSRMESYIRGCRSVKKSWRNYILRMCALRSTLKHQLSFSKLPCCLVVKISPNLMVKQHQLCCKPGLCSGCFLDLSNLLMTCQLFSRPFDIRFGFPAISLMLSDFLILLDFPVTKSFSSL